jgi:alkylation response protein AidB-like acyl-CoA dehydrogenase
MASYKAPVAEINFVLNDVLKVGELSQLPAFTDASPDVIRGVVDEAAKFIERELAPLNRKGDEIGCKYDNGQVKVPPGFTEAFHHFVEGGWVGLANPVEYGGQGLPRG